MENASKALIIAGAILLSILIISLGIIVVNNTRTTIDKANVDQTAAETFNARFEAYFGNSRTGSEARALISAVLSTAGEHTVSLTSGTGNITSISDVEYNKTYKIVESGTRSSGYITEITITANT